MNFNGNEARVAKLLFAKMKLLMLKHGSCCNNNAYNNTDNNNHNNYSRDVRTASTTSSSTITATTAKTISTTTTDNNVSKNILSSKSNRDSYALLITLCLPCYERQWSW